MIRIVGLGTISLDTVECAGQTAREVLGGSAPYFAAAARLSAPVGILGVVGEDFPQAHLERLREAGVDTSGVRRLPGKTFRWHVRYASDGSRTTVATNRAQALAARPDVPPAWRDPPVLFLGSTDPETQADVLRHAGTPALVVLDTMSHWVEARREVLDMVARYADVVFLTEEEARLWGEGDDEAAVRRLLVGGCSWVVVKRGAAGAVAFGQNRAVAASPARPARVVDPTGAGDAFAGGVVGALAASWPDGLGTEEALARGAALGSLAVESFSVDRLLATTEDEVQARAREVRLRVRRHPS